MKNRLLTLLILLSFAVTGFGETVSISTPADLIAFANRVNAGELALDAVLTNDIDMSGQAWAKPIGCWTPKVNNANVMYKGHFDGQGYTIKNLSYTTAQEYHGLFGVITTGALIENFSITGTITNPANSQLGVVGFARDNNPVIRNVHSYQNINNSRAGARIGGILGIAYTGTPTTVTIDRCTYSGTLDGNDAENNGNYGGFIGYTQSNANCIPVISNCLFDGVIKNSAASPGNCTFGGMVGYIGAGPAVTITNCLSIGTVTSKIYGQFFGAVKSTACSIVSSYYKGDIVNGSASTVTLPIQEATKVTDAQLASGEVTCKLGPAFRQKIGTDNYPKLGAGNDIVILNGTYQNPPSTLSLDENSDFAANGDFDVTSVTVARTLQGGKWDTFCVPFDMTAEEITSQLGAGTVVKELTGVAGDFDDYTLTFSDASGIVAGKTYMVKVQSDVTTITLSNKTIKGALCKTTIDELTLTGTYTDGAVPTGSFIINDNKTQRVTGLVSMKAFRGYITAPDGVVVKTLTFNLDGIEDGIEPSTQFSDRPTFSVLGNSISTYYDYIPSGYAIYYTADREKNNDIQVGDQWWMQLSRMSGLSFLANAAWSGSRVAFDSSTLNGIGPFCSDARVKALGRSGNPDFIFVLGGTNDWAHSSNIPLGEYCTTEFKDSLSFRGAYSLLLHKLTTRYPKTRVVCLSILPRGDAADKLNAAGWSQNDGNASIKHIAEQFGQYFIDCSTIPFSSNWSKYMISGNLHPTAAGFTLMAEHITKALIEQGIISADLKRSNEVEEANRLLDISFTQDGIVNKGTYDATVGKHGTATTVYDAENNIYLGSTKAQASDYFYATYDEGTPLADAFNKSVTWEMLVRLDAQADQNGNTTRTCILGNEQDGGWAFFNSDYASTFSYTHKSGVKSSVKNFKGNRILTAGKFYHLVVTMDRASHVIRYFVNGKLVRTGTRAATDMPLPQCGSVKGHQGMWICLGGDATSGSYDSGAENSSACSFVFARIYDGALTETAAANLYNDEMVKKLTQLDAAKISNAAELQAFRDKVNNGDVAADAILTSDIDMSGVAWSAPIGLWGSNQIAYRGHFDGQGYAITNLTYTTAQNFSGLFGVLSSDALVENFSLSGSVTNTDYSPFGGVVGFARDDNPTIRNVHSYMNISNSKAGARVGGVLGHANEASTVNVECCTYSGTLNANDAGGSGNYGGIVGYTQNATSSVLNITDCLFDGTVENTAATPGDCTFGGLVGYIGASPKVTATNCLSIGSVQSKIYGQFYGAVKNATCSIINSYYQGKYVNGAAGGAVTPGVQEAVKVTDEQLASGEVCFKLNGDQSIINWYQNIGTDNNPVLDKTHKKVIYDDVQGYHNENGNATSIGRPTPASSRNGGEVYDLAGRKVQGARSKVQEDTMFNVQRSMFNGLKRGVYIVNDKKVVIK